MKYFVFAALLLSFAFSSFGQAAPTQNVSVSEFEVNGLKVILKRRPSSPTVSAGLFVRGGVAKLTPENAGIENFAMSVAAEAGSKYPRTALRRELSRMASSIGAGSAYDFSVYSLSSTRENFDKTWDIFTDTVTNPAFTQSDFELVRERILTVLRDSGIRPDDALTDLESAVLFKNHSYAADPLGTAETVQKMTLADLKNYHKSILETSKLLLVVVGDIEPQVLQKQVVAAFGKLPKGNYKAPELKRLPFESSSVDVTTRSIPTTYIRGVFQAPSLGDPDYYAMRVAMTILQSRVYQEVRVRMNLSYAPNAEMNNRAANSANIYVTTNEPNRAVAAMLNQIETLKAQPVDTDNYEGLAGYFLTTYYLELETNAAQVAELARYELIGGGWRNADEFIRRIESVTPADIQSAARKYMRNIRFFVVGDGEKVDRSIFLQG